MARLHEYQGKHVLKTHGVHTPLGRVLTKQEALDVDFPMPVAVKAQAWTTSRFAKGLIRFADTAEEAQSHVEELRQRDIDGFPIDEVLVEERIHIAREYFLSYFVDDETATAHYIFSAVGGSGIEEILKTDPDAMVRGSIETLGPVRTHHVREVLRKAGIHGRELLKLGDLVTKALRAAREVEARSLEINPIVRTEDGRYLAADCRITVDDYAVYRHPELGIEIARDLSNPPTELDRIAYAVEQNDYRGTFYFTQLARGFSATDRYVGFHGAGGGGSMMSLDALSQHSFQAANYCDTSGNPPASKVYRAARIIASQENIVGYFGSGSGVASQEQIHSARGLVKAFLELGMSVPVVLRLGGNMEEEAVHILEHYTRSLPIPVRGFTKDAAVSDCVEALSEMVDTVERTETLGPVSPPERPAWLNDVQTYTFESPTGSVHYNHSICLDCTTKACVSRCVPQILQLKDGVPVLAISREDARSGKCIECLACEVECREHGLGGGFVHLPIPGLDQKSEGEGL